MKSAVAIVLVATAAVSAAGQGLIAPPAPREEKLLNGLRLLAWNDPKSEKVTVKIRIHSGAAFDPLGKEGVMKLLADIVFAGDSAKEYFREDLGGSLEVTSNYDYIQIDANGDADKFLTILETLAAAVTNPQINKETTERVRAAHILRLAELEKDPAYLADRAVANRLLGSFPYGRPMIGSSQSVGKIDFADLLFARQRFLMADNATLAISGNVKTDFAFRAAKRLLGGWLKSDKTVPATFARPDTPRPEIEIIDSTSPNTSELRFAMRGLARNDKDFHASRIVELILQKRIRDREGERSFARSAANVLPGMVTLGVSSWNTDSVKKIDNKVALPGDILTYQDHFLGADISNPEFETAKRLLMDVVANSDPLDYWLDSQTYRFASVKDDLNGFRTVSAADAQRVLEYLRKQSVASVLVVSSSTTTAASQ